MISPSPGSRDTGGPEPAGTGNRWVLYCAAIMVLTLLAFLPVFNNGFTNWDDDVYVTGNVLIRSLSWQNLLTIFSPTTFFSGNYQPITILSYALNHAAGGLDPKGYILVDLVIHLLNVLLVFIFIRKISGNDFAASFCALLFGIHPMHVESVAWIAGRKDLLYTFFYLASSLMYLAYSEKENGSARRWYAAALILFACSLLSKAMAVTLPAALLLIDYYRGRKLSARMVIDKIPFIVPAILIGLWTIKGQHQAGAIGDNGMLTVYSRVSIAAYSFLFYVVKFFIPHRLAALYPYPYSHSAALVLQYSLSPLFAVVIFGAVWHFRRSKSLVFGFMFFLINVLLNLHFVPVGGTVTADRYSYIAYIGLSFIVARGAARGVDDRRLKKRKIAIVAVIFGFLIVAFGYAVHERCRVWKNSETLWTDVLEKYPSAVACNNRGLFYDARGDRAHAVQDYDRAIAYNPCYADAWNNRSVEYLTGGDYETALQACNRAIALNPSLAEAYDNRGNILSYKEDYAGAIDNYNRALSLKPSLAEAYLNRGNAYGARGDYPQAITDFTRAIALDPKAYPQAWYCRGFARRSIGDIQDAVEDFTAACSLHFDEACRELEGRGGETQFNHGIP